MKNFEFRMKNEENVYNFHQQFLILHSKFEIRNSS